MEVPEPTSCMAVSAEIRCLVMVVTIIFMVRQVTISCLATMVMTICTAETATTRYMVRWVTMN